MRPGFAAIFLTAAAAVAAASGDAARAAPPASAAAPAIRLAPHRAVYDLALVASRGMRGIESASGRIALELTGNACDGYGLKFRQVTVVDGAETGSKTNDVRTANQESGDGRTFRFRIDTAAEGGPTSTVEGDAERRPGGLAVRVRAPKRAAAALEGEALFPNAQMREIIGGAREGRRLVPTRLFDGSEDGLKVYETLAVIGARIEEKPDETLEEAARKPDLAKLARWPVVLSYFPEGKGDRVPAYTLAFELYDNGVSRALKLDYGDFVLRGDLVRLDLLADARPCAR